MLQSLILTALNPTIVKLADEINEELACFYNSPKLAVVRIRVKLHLSSLFLLVLICRFWISDAPMVRTSKEPGRSLIPIKLSHYAIKLALNRIPSFKKYTTPSCECK